MSTAMNAQTTHGEVHHLKPEDARLGMWLFLFTEIMLFGGLFLLYSVYRYRYGHEFQAGSAHMNVLAGSINTMILLTSSLTVVLSIELIKKGKHILSAIMLVVTLLMGGVFLGVKYVEWSEKIAHGIYPGSDTLLDMGSGETIYYGLYYMMTGLHAIHVIIGMTLFLVLLFPLLTGRITQKRPLLLENGGLYWHLVDIIWIFLFPLFYLI